MGNLYTAAVAGTPLLVLVGARDSRLLHTGPILDGPLEQMRSHHRTRARRRAR
jgi:thiamine pyrophosphate-dependent acetolactate synthase large subunit-like protein